LEQSEEDLPKTEVQFNDEEILKEKRKCVIHSFIPSFLLSFLPSFLPQYYPRREMVYVALFPVLPDVEGD